MKNQTAVPVNVLTTERGDLFLVRELLIDCDRRTLIKIFNCLPHDRLMSPLLDLIDAFLIVEEHGIPDMRITECGSAELYMVRFFNGIKRQDREDSLNLALNILEDTFIAHFKTQGDTGSQPIPVAKLGEKEAIWQHVVSSDSTKNDYCNSCFGISASELQKRLIDIITRTLKLSGRGIFESEEEAAKNYLLWQSASLNVLARAWPVVDGLGLVGELLGNPNLHPKLLQPAAGTVKQMGHFADSLRPSLLSALGMDGPTSANDYPQWYEDSDFDSPEEMRKGVLWETLAGLYRDPFAKE